MTQDLQAAPAGTSDQSRTALRLSAYGRKRRLMHDAGVLTNKILNTMHTPKVIIHRLQVPAMRRRVWPSRIFQTAAALAGGAAVLTSLLSF